MMRQRDMESVFQGQCAGKSAGLPRERQLERQSERHLPTDWSSHVHAIISHDNIIWW